MSSGICCMTSIFHILMTYTPNNLTPFSVVIDRVAGSVMRYCFSLRFTLSEFTFKLIRIPFWEGGVSKI